MTAKRKCIVALGVVLLLTLAIGMVLNLRGGGGFRSRTPDPSPAVEGLWIN